MKDFDLQKLLQREMSRKEFLALTAVVAASAVGITGLLKELQSHASTPTASVEPENGTLSGGGASVVADNSASNSKAVKFAPSTTQQKQMYVGAAWSNSGAGSDVTSVVGNMMHRTYESGIPASFSASRSGQQDYPNHRGCWQSLRSPTTWLDFSAGKYDAALTTYVNSIPTNYPILLTFNHEPDNGDDDGVPAHFAAAAAHFYTVVKAHRPDIPVGPIFTGWLFDPANHAATPAAWDPGPGKRDFWGIDTYQKYLFPPSGSPTTWQYSPTPQLTSAQAFADGIGVPLAIGELACGSYQGSNGLGTPDYQMKVDFITGQVNYVESRGGFAFCYFNTDINNDMSPNALLGDDSGTTAYWKSLLATHQRGLF